MSTAAELQRQAATLKATGRAAEALPLNRRAVDQDPTSAVAWYNLAATLGDLQLAEEAVTAAHRAIALGLQAPEANLTLARALLLQHKYDEAEGHYRETLRKRAMHPDALRELSQLLWMKTADLARALEPIDDALRANPGDPGLVHLRAIVQRFAGDIQGAAEILARGVGRNRDDLRLLCLATDVEIERGEPRRALWYANEAAARAPGAKPVREAFALASLAAGNAEDAAKVAQVLRKAAPFDQMAINIQVDAWRLLSDDRYRELYDYDAFVRPYTIETPDGWSDLPGFLADLTRTLDGMHRLQTHPLQQSLRHGSQVQSLHLVDNPVLKAFFGSIDKAVARYMAEVGQGSDPLRARNTGKARVHSAWSVRLRPTGFHVNHFHPEGWLSSAFYVETPDQALDTPGREAWIKFGEPGIRTQPPLAAEHFVRPEPGRLVLFPSYMWHGTVPFTSNERRMTIAFDVVPA